MFYSFPNIVQDSLSFYLKATEAVIHCDHQKVDIGCFDYLPLESNELFFAIDSTFLAGTHDALPVKSGILLPVPDWMTTSIFLIFLFCFAIFSQVVRNTRGAFVVNFKNRLSMRKDAHASHKIQVTTAETWGEFFMIVQSIVILGIVFFIYLTDYVPISSTPFVHFIGFSIVFWGLALFAVIKFLMYKAISSFFFPTDLTRWRGHYYGHLQLMGIFLFLPAFVFVFLQEYRSVMIFMMFAIFFINRAMVLSSLLNIFVKNKVGPIYFILYLCGTEIAPYLMFYKGARSIVYFAGNYLV